MTMCLNSICMAWSNTANTYSIDILKAKMEWGNDATQFYGWFFNVLDHSGKVVGAWFSGRILVKGRRGGFL